MTGRGLGWFPGGPRPQGPFALARHPGRKAPSSHGREDPRMGVFQRLANPFLLRALRTGHPTRLGTSLMAITVTGVKTGRDFTFPVQFVRDGDTIWVLPGHPESKTWWRNLRSGAPVRLHLEGVDGGGTAVASAGGADPEEAVRGLRAYLRRAPA